MKELFLSLLFLVGAVGVYLGMLTVVPKVLDKFNK